ncbi:MAG: hypothetical protein KC546_03485, partial [Anaerolineae bacterium]|nr:hypothetical protein [Anaerolineae bacterium]
VLRGILPCSLKNNHSFKLIINNFVDFSTFFHIYMDFSSIVNIYDQNSSLGVIIWQRRLR